MCSARINRGFLFNTVSRVEEAFKPYGNRLKARFIRCAYGSDVFGENTSVAWRGKWIAAEPPGKWTKSYYSS